MYKIRSHEIPKCAHSSFQTLMEKKNVQTYPVSLAWRRSKQQQVPTLQPK